MFCVKCREENEATDSKFRRAVGRLQRVAAENKGKQTILCPVHAAKTVTPVTPTRPPKVVEDDIVLLDDDGHIICPEVERLIQEMREYVRSDGINNYKREMPKYSLLHPVEVVDLFKM